MVVTISTLEIISYMCVSVCASVCARVCVCVRVCAYVRMYVFMYVRIFPATVSTAHGKPNGFLINVRHTVVHLG